MKVENEKNSQLFQIFDQKMKEVQQIIEQNTHLKKLYIAGLKKYLIQLEEKTRKEKRLWINEQQVRLGRYHVSAGVTSRCREMWHDGEAYHKFNHRLAAIQAEKEEIEKLKKNRKRDIK